MLSRYQQRYQEFAQLLEGLQLQAANSVIEGGELRQSVQQAQQFFGQKLLTLDSSDLSPAQEAQIRAYQTEISKQLQLLGMDVRFLQAARAQATATNRQIQLKSRIETLLSYCKAIIELA